MSLPSTYISLCPVSSLFRKKIVCFQERNREKENCEVKNPHFYLHIFNSMKRFFFFKSTRLCFQKVLSVHLPCFLLGVKYKNNSELDFNYIKYIMITYIFIANFNLDNYHF